MSALALLSAPLSTQSWEPITELDATRQVSRVGAAATELEEGIDTLVKVALRASGIIRIELAPEPPLLSQIPQALGFGSTVAGITVGIAVAEIKAERKRWGTLRVFFGLQPETIENPLRFARYLGQQIGVLLVRTELLTQQQALKRKAALLGDLVAKRKAIHRARALLRHAHNISEDEAFVLMRRYVHQTGRTMHQIAEAIVFSDQNKWKQARVTQFSAADDQPHHRSARKRR